MIRHNFPYDLEGSVQVAHNLWRLTNFPPKPPKRIAICLSQKPINIGRLHNIVHIEWVY